MGPLNSAQYNQWVDKITGKGNTMTERETFLAGEALKRMTQGQFVGSNQSKNLFMINEYGLAECKPDGSTEINITEFETLFSGQDDFLFWTVPDPRKPQPVICSTVDELREVLPTLKASQVEFLLTWPKFVQGWEMSPGSAYMHDGQINTQVLALLDLCIRYGGTVEVKA